MRQMQARMGAANMARANVSKVQDEEMEKLMAKGTLSNQLLGRKVKPREELHVWNLKPNLSGEFFGTIEAAWIDEDGNLKIQIKGPTGDTCATWLDHCLLAN